MSNIQLDLINTKYSMDELIKIVGDGTGFSNIGWDLISVHQELSMEFIERYEVWLNLFNLSYHQMLSVEFIRRNKDYLDFTLIYYNKKIRIGDKLIFSVRYRWKDICRVGYIWIDDYV